MQIIYANIAFRQSYRTSEYEAESQGLCTKGYVLPLCISLIPITTEQQKGGSDEEHLCCNDC